MTTDDRINLESLKSKIIEAATYKASFDDAEERDFSKLRIDIISTINKDELPNCIRVCSTLQQIRRYFQEQSPSYKPRRAAIDKEFQKSLSIDKTLNFENIIKEIDNSNLNILPDDVKEKGKELSEVYCFLYCIENSLRIFITNIFLEKFGQDFWDKITIPSSIKKTIITRKEEEAKKKWISVRGDSNIFYLDFKDLGDLILNNWETFKVSFPDQAWIKSKIDELGDCRNLIAHNSYLGEHEISVIRVNYTSIIKQINN